MTARELKTDDISDLVDGQCIYARGLSEKCYGISPKGGTGHHYIQPLLERMPKGYKSVKGRHGRICYQIADVIAALCKGAWKSKGRLYTQESILATLKALLDDSSSPPPNENKKKRRRSCEVTPADLMEGERSVEGVPRNNKRRKIEESKQAESKKDEAKPEESKKEEAKQEESKKEEVKQEESKKEEVKQEEAQASMEQSHTELVRTEEKQSDAADLLSLEPVKQQPQPQPESKTDLTPKPCWFFTPSEDGKGFWYTAGHQVYLTKEDHERRNIQAQMASSNGWPDDAIKLLNTKTSPNVLRAGPFQGFGMFKW
jgi:hypothetical protein